MEARSFIYIVHSGAIHLSLLCIHEVLMSMVCGDSRTGQALMFHVEDI